MVAQAQIVTFSILHHVRPSSDYFLLRKVVQIGPVIWEAASCTAAPKPCFTSRPTNLTLVKLLSQTAHVLDPKCLICSQGYPMSYNPTHDSDNKSLVSTAATQTCRTALITFPLLALQENVKVAHIPHWCWASSWVLLLYWA